jgi:hypothetical protein
MLPLLLTGAGVMQVPEQQSISSNSSSNPSISGQLQEMLQQLNDKEAQLQAMSADLCNLEEAAAPAADTALVAGTEHAHALDPAQFQATDSSKQVNCAVYSYPTVSVRVLPVAAAADACSAPSDCLVAADPELSSDAAAAAASRRWRCVAARRGELLLRWQCLLEERKQLTLLLQAEQGEEQLLLHITLS